MAGALHVLLVGSSSQDSARLRSLALPASALAMRACRDANEALAVAKRSPVDALLVGPLRHPRELPLHTVAQLAEGSCVPIFLLLAEGNWDSLDWEPVLRAGADGVLHLRDGQDTSLGGRLRYEIARAEPLRRERRARARVENAHAAMVRLGRVVTRAEFEQAAVDAMLALRGGGGACALMMVEGDELVLAQARGLADDEARALACLTIGLSDHPAALAARTRRCLWHAERAPTMLATDPPVAMGGLQGALPLVTDGCPLGVVWLTFPPDNHPSPDDRLGLEQLSVHLAETLARTLHTDALREHEQFAQRMVGVAAHDLRSPLQVIAMASDLLSHGGAVTPPERRFLERIRESAKCASELVAQLLTVARSSGGQAPPTFAEADAFLLLSNCVDDFRVRAPECLFELTLSGSGSARLDGYQFTQVVHNLLANAVHYRLPGSTIAVRGMGATDRVYVEIHNQGPAIPDDQMAELFTAMKRGSSKGEQGSLGLGLYIVKMLVEGAGGRIWARSTERDGTTFTIELRRDPDDAPERGIGAPMAARRATTSTSRPPPSEIPPAYRSLLSCMPRGGLDTLLRHWLELGGASHLPHPHQLDRARLLAYLPDMFWVDVLGERGDRPRFRFTELGGVLERRLDGRRPSLLTSMSSADLEIRPSLLEAYARCVHSARPVFDYLRSGPSRAREENFLRLILPFSRDGRHVTQLIGMALFQGFEEAALLPARTLRVAKDGDDRRTLVDVQRERNLR